MWMNDLFRKLNIKSFWAHPGCVHIEKDHTSTTSGLDFISYAQPVTSPNNNEYDDLYKTINVTGIYHIEEKYNRL